MGLVISIESLSLPMAGGGSLEIKPEGGRARGDALCNG